MLRKYRPVALFPLMQPFCCRPNSLNFFFSEDTFNYFLKTLLFKSIYFSISFSYIINWKQMDTLPIPLDESSTHFLHPCHGELTAYIRHSFQAQLC